MKKFDRAGCAALGAILLGLLGGDLPVRFRCGESRFRTARGLPVARKRNRAVGEPGQTLLHCSFGERVSRRAGQGRERSQRRVETAGASRGGAGERRKGAGRDGDRSEGRRRDCQRRAETGRARDCLRPPDPERADRLLRLGGRSQDRSAAGFMASGQYQGRRPDRRHRRLADRRQRASVRKRLYERAASRCSTRARARKSPKSGRRCGIPRRRKPKWSKSSQSRTTA